jgi:hypothetical protein
MRADYWFPGRWVGGTALIFAPVLLLAGILLRLPYHFFFPQQLAAFHQDPARMTAAYSCFVAGNILLWPAIVTLAQRIGATKPAWAAWGGTLAICGLFARTFHGGVDHLAFQLVRLQGVDAATKTVAASYGAFHIASALNAAIVFGWIVLAIGAYVSGVLGLIRSIGLGLMAALMLGVLKGTSTTSIAAVCGLCAALIPLGFTVLREPPVPPWRAYAMWFALLAVLLPAMFFLGQKG